MSAHVQLLGRPAQPDPLIRDSWQRCYDSHGLEPDRVPEPDVLTQAEFGVVRAPAEELATLAQGELDRMLRQLGDHVHLLMLANPDGTLMVVRADSQLDALCRAALIQPGARFNESSQGTNGIGLCIQTLSPVSVVMEEHFAQRLTGLSCTVAPIFGHRGELAAVLNVTSLKPSNRTVHEIARKVVESSARRIENRSFDLRCAGRLVLRLSPTQDFCDPAGEGRIALDDSGRVLDATPAALQMLGADSAVFGQRLHGLDDVDGLIRSLRGPRPVIEPLTGLPLNVQLASTSSHAVRAAPLMPRARVRQADAAQEDRALQALAGSDPHTGEQLRIARRLYERGLPILLQGESGTGKTRLARALHDAGPRRGGQFVAINCAAIPAELIESELFGYRPGAFTGAAKHGARGRLLQADGGTLFLDEIGDMPLALQSRFLQVLSEKEFVPVGATEPVRVDFGLIAASFRDIAQMVQMQRFRADLHFRIQGAALSLSALRDRADLDELIAQAITSAAGQAGMDAPSLSAAARLALSRYHWPGNFRELLHVARYALALCDGQELGLDCLPAPLNTAVPHAACAPADPANPEAVLAALTRSDWNVSATAQALGISRSTLHRRMRAWRITRPT